MSNNKNEKPHYRDRKPKRSRSRSRSSLKKDNYRSKSPQKQKSSEYYIEKYRAIYQTKMPGVHKQKKSVTFGKKTEDKDESVVFFRKKYGGEIKNLFTKHSDVFYLDIKHNERKKLEKRDSKNFKHKKNEENEKTKKEEIKKNVLIILTQVF